MGVSFGNLMPSASSTGAGLVMLIKSQEQASTAVSFIGQRQNNSVKIYGNEAAKLFKIKDVAALSKSFNPNIGQIVDLVA
ncbi:MAG: hypothetical protein PHC92_04140 [Syntrophomonadaceae bacterium]|nr:hypothetical protein [Syntrophomonadaceae bacterium]MDD3024203.1 hypothetical protein [Syntrophomonadaceae bacterium]